MSNWVTVGANRVYALVEGEFTYQSWIDALEKGSTFISNSPFIFAPYRAKIRVMRSMFQNQKE